MSRRKGTNSRRIDNDYDRNGKFLVDREGESIGSTRSEKQLFNPRADNPIKFNKSINQEETTHSERRLYSSRREEFSSRRDESSSRRDEYPSRRDDYPSKRDEFSSRREYSSARQDNSYASSEDTLPRRNVTTGRKLWNPNDSERVSPLPTFSPTLKQRENQQSPSLKQKEIQSASLKQKEAQSPIPKQKEIQPSPIRLVSNQTKTTVQPKKANQKASPDPDQPSPTESQPDPADLKRKTLKTLIVSLRQIEAKLEALDASSQDLACFSQDLPIPDCRDLQLETVQPTKAVQDITRADQVWKEKIKLHLSLGDTYLEVLSHDLAYAEKKGLESLCWKRAVYSLVNQFRRALKRSAETMISSPQDLRKRQVNATLQVIDESVVSQSKLAAMLEEDLDELVTEIPIIHEGGGMTFMKVEKETKKKETVDTKLEQEHAKMILGHFLDYLDLADDFYLRLSLFLKTVDESSNDEMEACLTQWRRVQKYKWYSCIPLRADIARYRWVYTPDEVKVEADMAYDDLVPITRWTKTEAFEEAWKRYFLGIWLMPAKGNLYFNLSLLLQQVPPHNTQGHEFHKLYFSTRSLMVRRNGFLNARESMLVLFESNRRWIQKYVDGQLLKDSKKSRTGTHRKSFLRDKKDATLPALFVRLHGMLFTKIGLDEFAKIRRTFFDILFERKQSDDYQPERQPSQPQLSRDHFFWIETIVVCLSSLYTYDFAGSKLSKLTSLNFRRLFYKDVDESQFKALVEDMSDSLLFSYEINMICQIATELFQRYLDPRLPQPVMPQLPELPQVSFNIKENSKFIFGPVLDESGERIHARPEPKTESVTDRFAWLVYIETLLHWMVLNGVCIRTPTQDSLWEMIVGDIGYDLMSYQQKKFVDMMDYHRASKISPGFWPHLLQCLNKLLSELPEEDKYHILNKHLLDDEEEQEELPEDISEAEFEFAKNVLNILSLEPDLPEEEHLRGLGWVDDIHGRFLKIKPKIKKSIKPTVDHDVVTCRKMKILEYGFTLVKHLDDILYYDPVEEIFTLSKSVEDRINELQIDEQANKERKENDPMIDLYDSTDSNENIVMTSMAEMDDDVLLSSETELEEQNEGDDIMTQLKKRREQLQSIVSTVEAEEKYGFRSLPNRVKEREERLNYLCERIVPGKTVLVLDTNCFIGHIDYVKKLFRAQKWSIVVPLVVVTELDGLKTNTHKLGRFAREGLELLEKTLLEKPKQSTSLRIQTSHNNFMNDISIRSEQFMFGESDKNLDDLILSTCLWWISQQSNKDKNDKNVSVCLVTGDRNLSVKARARDVEVVPVSAIIRLTTR